MVGGFALVSGPERVAEVPHEPAVALRLTPAPEPPPAAPEPTNTATATAPPAPAVGDDQKAALPRVAAPDTLPPWKRNSRPFDQNDSRPRIAVVVTGLGLSSAATEAAIKQLPPAITLSFTPYAPRLGEYVSLARVNGHEVMLDLPMEPTSYPDDDPGPQALLTALSERQNLERLRWALDRANGYVGVAAVMGSRFLASVDHLEPILEEIKRSGLVFLDNRASDESIGGELASKIGVPNAVNDRFLDRTLSSPVAIDARLIQLERIAFTDGAAVAMGRPYQVTIERLRDWSKEVEKRGYVLAPITAIAARKLDQGAAAHGAKTAKTE